MIFGGTDADALYGDEGDDWLSGGTENDALYGGAGDDLLLGGDGDDLLHSGDGNDVLLGNEGNDTLRATGTSALLSGGKGQDVFLLEADTIVTIQDFEAGSDLLDIAQHFEHPDEVAEFSYAQENHSDPKVLDLVIELPNGGRLLLEGSGALAEQPWKIVSGWEDHHPHLPDESTVPSTTPESDAVPYEDDSDEDDDSDSSGGAGMGLVAALFGGLLMLGGIG